MDPSTQVLLIFRGVLLVHALTDVAYEKIYFTAGISSVWGASIIAAISEFVGGGKTETSLMVLQLNNFGPKFHC